MVSLRPKDDNQPFAVVDDGWQYKWKDENDFGLWNWNEVNPHFSSTLATPSFAHDIFVLGVGLVWMAALHRAKPAAKTAAGLAQPFALGVSFPPRRVGQFAPKTTLPIWARPSQHRMPANGNRSFSTIHRMAGKIVLNGVDGFNAFQHPGSGDLVILNGMLNSREAWAPLEGRLTNVGRAAAKQLKILCLNLHPACIYKVDDE
jgi:hypothetical protein